MDKDINKDLNNEQTEKPAIQQNEEYNSTEKKEELNNDGEVVETSDMEEILEFEKESDFKENDIPEPVVEKISDEIISNSDEIENNSNEESEPEKESEEEGLSEKEPEEENEEIIEKNNNSDDLKSVFEEEGDKEEKDNLFKNSVLEQNKEKLAESNKIKPPKKSFKESWKSLKKPVKILAIVGILLILLGGALGITHAIVTRNIVFVHNEEDLFEALEKGKGDILYIKNNVTVNSDVVFTKPYDINLHGNTLTVNGSISYDLDKSEETVFISTIKSKQNINQGKLIANSFVFSGEKSTLDIYSDINAAIHIKSATTVNFRSVSSTIQLEDLVKTFNLYGSAQQIDRGNKIVLFKGSQVNTVSNAAKLIVQPGSSVKTIINCNSPIFVEKLEAPKNIMVDSSRAIEKILIFTFNKVVNANDYVIRIDGDTVVPVIRPNGEDAGTISEDGDKITVTYYAEQLVPNNYEVSIYAVAAEESREYYLDSDTASAKFTVSIQLPEPIIDNIDKENGKIIISYNQYVSAYYIKINDQSIIVDEFTKDENDKISIDIKDKISEVGSYSISVVAHSDHSYYSDSDPCYKSLIITKKLDSPVFNTVNVDGDLYTFSWQTVENAKFYKIVVTVDEESTEYYTSLTSFTISLDPLKTNTVSFNSVKNGYYLDSDVVVCPIDYVVEIPEETPEE